MQVSLECGSVHDHRYRNARGRRDRDGLLHFSGAFRKPAGRRWPSFSRDQPSRHPHVLQIDMADGQAQVLASMSQTGSAINDATLDRLLSVALRFADRAFTPMLGCLWRGDGSTGA